MNEVVRGKRENQHTLEFITVGFGENSRVEKRLQESDSQKLYMKSIRQRILRVRLCVSMSDMVNVHLNSCLSSLLDLRKVWSLDEVT